MRADETLISDYLLGELDPGERAAVEERAQTDPAFAAAIARMRPVVAGLEEMPEPGWGAGEPPPLPALPPLPGLTRPRRTRAWIMRPAVILGAVALAFAAGFGVRAWVAGGGDDGEGPPLELARIGEAGAAARGEAHVVGSGDGSLRLSVSGLAPTVEGAFYEVWLMDGPGRLVSLGSFRVPASGAADVDVPLPVPVRDFAYVNVSAEPDDGDPAHSGASVLRGPTGTG